MAKKNLIWTVELGFLTGRTPKTHKMVYSYDLYADLGTPEEVRKDAESTKANNYGFSNEAHNKSHNIYTYLYRAMEEIGLTSVATRTAQLMDVLQDWYYKYITCSVEECDITVGDICFDITK